MKLETIVYLCIHPPRRTSRRGLGGKLASYKWLYCVIGFRVDITNEKSLPTF